METQYDDKPLSPEAQEADRKLAEVRAQEAEATDTKLRRILDFIPPGDIPMGEPLTVLSYVADALTAEQIEVFGEYLDDTRQRAEQRAFDEGKRALIEAMQRKLEAEEGTG